MVEIRIKKDSKVKLRKKLLEDLASLVDSFVYNVNDYKGIQKQVFGEYDFHKVTGIYVDVTHDESEGNKRTIQVTGKNSKGKNIAIRLKLNTKEGNIRVIFLSDKARVEESLEKSLSYTDHYIRGINSFVETFLGYYDLKSYDMSSVYIDCLYEGSQFKYYLTYFVKTKQKIVQENKRMGVLENGATV